MRRPERLWNNIEKTEKNMLWQGQQHRLELCRHAREYYLGMISKMSKFKFKTLAAKYYNAWLCIVITVEEWWRPSESASTVVVRYDWWRCTILDWSLSLQIATKHTFHRVQMRQDDM